MISIRNPLPGRPGSSPFDEDFFTLGGPVGPGQPNRREDVIKVETILGNTGHHDLARTDGPLGYWGERQEKAIKSWQEQNRLKIDGLLNPGGPTITSLKQAAGGLLSGFKPPTPDEVDEHHVLRLRHAKRTVRASVRWHIADGQPGLVVRALALAPAFLKEAGNPCFVEAIPLARHRTLGSS